MVPSELGATLQQHREESGLSLEELEARTHIRRKYLEALEAGDWAALPPGVYTRGLLKSYAKAVGLSSNSVMRMYAKERPQEARLPEPQLISQPLVEEPRYSPELLLAVALFAVAAVLLVALWQTELRPLLAQGRATLAGEPTAVPPAPTVVVAAEASPTAERRTNTPEATAVLSGTAVTGGATSGTPGTPGPPAFPGGTVTARAGPGSPAAVSPTPPIGPGGTAEGPVIPIRPPAGTAPPTARPTAPTTPLNLEVLATGKVWLRVIADGEEVFSGFMQAGERQGWAAREAVTMRTGNVGGTQASINGEPVGSLGEGATVVTCQWRLLPDGAIEQSC